MLVRLTRFLRLLREHGFALGLAEAEDALRIAQAVPLDRPAELRLALKALLCGCRTDARRFDELFDVHWLRRGVRTALVGGQLSGRGVRRESGAAVGRPGLPDRAERGPGGEATPADGVPAPATPRASPRSTCATSPIRRNWPASKRWPSGWRRACGCGSPGAIA